MYSSLVLLRLPSASRSHQRSAQRKQSVRQEGPLGGLTLFNLNIFHLIKARKFEMKSQFIILTLRPAWSRSGGTNYCDKGRKKKKGYPLYPKVPNFAIGCRILVLDLISILHWPHLSFSREEQGTNSHKRKDRSI